MRAVLVGFAIGSCLAACAASVGERRGGSNEHAVDNTLEGDASVRIHAEPWGEFTIGGPDASTSAVAFHASDASTEPVALRPDDGGSLAVTRDAGAMGGELAWLVAHIGDTPDRLRSDDSDNVRQIAARGADGVRAVVNVFERVDSARIPFARRVVERNILRVCHRRDREDAQMLASWIELGDEAPAAIPDGTMHWNRSGETAWPREAITRLGQWIDAGLPCRPLGTSSSSPPPAASSSSPPREASSPRPAAGATERSTSRRP